MNENKLLEILKISLSDTPSIGKFHWIEDETKIYEFVHLQKRLMISVSEGEMGYIKSWGPDIQNEMKDGLIQDANCIAKLIRWLRQE